jgi:hypothetical protein
MDRWHNVVKGKYPIFGLLNIGTDRKALKQEFRAADLLDDRKQILAYLNLAIDYFDAEKSKYLQPLTINFICSVSQFNI